MRYLTLFSGGQYKIDVARVLDVPSRGGAFSPSTPLPAGLSMWSPYQVYTYLEPNSFIVGVAPEVQSQTIIYTKFQYATTAFWQTPGQIMSGTDEIEFNILPRQQASGGYQVGDWFLGWAVLIDASFNSSCSVDIVFETSPWGLVSVEFVFRGGFDVEGLGKSFLISAELQQAVQSSADLVYSNIDLYAEFTIFSEGSAVISFESLALSAEASAQAQASADFGNAVLFLNAFFSAAGAISSPVRTALGRGDWRRVVGLGGDSGALNIERERWRVEDRGSWGAQQHIIRNRDLCPEIGEEVADAVYQSGGFLGPSNEIPEAAPVGNRGRIPAPSGQWFAVSRVRPVRHVDWEYCEGRAERCEVVPAEWRHSPSLVPYPHLFLQTNVTGSDCSPVNRLRNGAGPAMWIAHFKGRSIPDWKLIAAIILRPDSFYAIAIMAVGPMDNAVSEWGPWEPSESSICNGAEFIQRSFDLKKVRRPKTRKAIGTSMEDCEYGLPWFDGVYDIKNWEMLVFDGRTAVRALWFDENEAAASALYLPVGENGASVFIG